MTLCTGIKFAPLPHRRTTALTESRHRVMSLPPTPLNPPQTAADLLDGLLRSRLLADSLFRLVWEQSSLYLERRADEYAAALVEKRVLTQWQASELLAGRIGFYAGTFRLFEKLVATESSEVLVAEQPGLQRLVLLQRIPVETADGSVAFRSARGRSFSEQKTTLPQTTRHPHIVGCVEVQYTAQSILEAYEFIEARSLSELLAVKPLNRGHVAELVQQLAAVLPVLSNEAVGSIGVEDAWIDRHGQLKLLAGPNPWASESEWSESVVERDALQLAAVHRFAASLGGLPEIAKCQSVNAVKDRLMWSAELWLEPFASETLRCPRVRMNRLLRRGPARRLIESFSEKLQVTGESVREESATSESLVSRPDLATAVEGRSLPTTGMTPAPKKPTVGFGRRALALTVLLSIMAAGIVATQWFEQRGVRRAEATTDPVVSPEAQPPVTPVPLRTSQFPLPQ